MLIIRLEEANMMQMAMRTVENYSGYGDMQQVPSINMIAWINKNHNRSTTLERSVINCWRVQCLPHPQFLHWFKTFIN